MIEILDELANYFKREVNITEESNITEDNAEQELKNSISYIFDCVGLIIDTNDIEIDLDE